MNLELLISPSGFGKTQFMLDDIEKNRNNSKIIVLTPEQNSFNFEKMLCEKFGGTFNIDVMNFSSLTKKFSKDLGLESLKNLSEDIKPFYFYKAAQNLESRDNFLVKRILQDSSFIEVVDDIIKELKEYKITINTLEDYLEKNDTLEKARREKLEAILELYVEYMTLLREAALYDKQDYINELLLYIEHIKLSDYIFYIDAYYNFTAQEYYYIEKLITYSKKVVLSVIADANRYFNAELTQIAQGYELENIKYKPFYLAELYKEDKYKLDIFRKSHEIVASINEILRRNNKIKLNVVAFVESDGDVKEIKLSVNADKVSYELLGKHKNRFEGLANNQVATKYYKNFKSSFEHDDSIEILEAKNKELEIKQVAREIVKLKKEQGIKNSEVAVLYRDAVYENYEQIFKDYELDIHIDKDIDVSNHRLIKFLELVLNFENSNFKTSIVNILKTKLTNFENIYKRKVVSFVLTEGNTNLSEKEIQKLFDELDKEEYKERIIRAKEIIKLSEEKKTIYELYADIKAISVDELENIVNEKLVTSKEVLLNAEFISEKESSKNFSLRICLDILVELINKIESISKNKNIQAKRYVKRIEELFDYCNIRMYLDKEDGEYDDIEELKIDSIDRQVYKKALEFFQSIIDNFGNEKIEYTKFSELMLLGLKTLKYRSIPEINESIIMSSMDLAKVENKKVVFVVGFNKDVLPISKKSGLLDDSDKENFYTSGVYLSPTTKDSLIDEEFVAYIALTRAKQKTYISYSLLDKSFKENFASPYLNVVEKLLPNIQKKETAKILEFNTAEYDYYLGNMNEFLSYKEYNYLFAKIYRRFIEVKDSESQETEELAKLLVLFLANYEVHDEYYSQDNHEVYEKLNDRVYFEKNIATKNYLDKIIRDYKFELTKENIDRFLLEKKSTFSKFSISKVSDYEKNPYLFFVKRILGIKQEANIDIDNLAMGRFFHAIMADERVINFIVKSGETLDLNILQDVDIARKFKIRKVIDDVIINNNNNDIKEALFLLEQLSTHSYLLENMKRRLELAIAVEIKYHALTKYTPTYLEKEFSLTITEDEVNCIHEETGETITKKLETKYKIPTITFRGVIDRVDVFGKNIAVIDYKSSKTDFSLESLELGFISQILTYSLASEMLFNKKSEDILGIFYREIARIGKDIKDYRLRGLGNSDLILQSDFSENNAEVMYIRTTKKGGIHGADIAKAYSSPELKILVEKNLDNVLKLLEKIYEFNYNLSLYEVDNEYEAERQTLFNYAANSDTRLEYKEKVTLKAKELRDKILNKS